ncbi:hypothetical protein PF005_g26162 [Phytophthora fragariae]|uniref:RxLR effector protein n=1 Tax=Phytophthora fragariae TaxID=53985 RepID=A0A6A3VZ19_9STRA|nr:hypothetical protein PF003_g6648 [Phytophthora fragariae]KAE8934586.1 hypothetical protein PF009_g15432 [Phytophthora fragariae]KAE9080300.1 hypothetical protein PF006_g27341 [Phytophthora fragariae]KAE9102534.1 hypothetical protein PF007_g14737 [Phytophthora fragariae]KAE9173707.1 hypothetical protein PF005_g26162 [Phytophthora fragariae]
MHRSLMLTFFSLVSLTSIDAFTRARYTGRGATSTALPVPLRRPSCFDRDLDAPVRGGARPLLRQCT